MSPPGPSSARSRISRSDSRRSWQAAQMNCSNSRSDCSTGADVILSMRSFRLRARGCQRDRKLECGAAADFRFHPNPAAAALYDLLAESQPDPRSGDFFAMQPLQDPEDPLGVLGIDADSVVANFEQPGRSAILRRHMNAQG